MGRPPNGGSRLSARHLRRRAIVDPIELCRLRELRNGGVACAAEGSMRCRDSENCKAVLRDDATSSPGAE